MYFQSHIWWHCFVTLTGFCHFWLLYEYHLYSETLDAKQKNLSVNKAN